MYEKIRTNWFRAGAIFSALADAFGPDVERVAGMTAADFETFNDDRPLEELVEGFGIHDWLQNQINHVEQVEATIVSAGLEIAGERAAEVAANAAAGFGRTIGMQVAEGNGGPTSDASMLFKFLDSSHLETMPCTQIAEFGQNDGGHVYRHVSCPHLENWEQGGGNAKVMCDVVRAWFNGFCKGAGSGIVHKPGPRIVDGDRHCEDYFVAEG